MVILAEPVGAFVVRLPSVPHQKQNHQRPRVVHRSSSLLHRVQPDKGGCRPVQVSKTYHTEQDHTDVAIRILDILIHVHTNIVHKLQTNNCAHQTKTCRHQPFGIRI